MRTYQDIAQTVSTTFNNSTVTELDVTAKEAFLLENNWAEFINQVESNLRSAIALVHGNVLDENRHYILYTYDKNCNHF